VNQNLVILSPEEAGKNGLAPIGTRAEIIKALDLLNTSPEREGDDVLWGPGIRIDMPPDKDPVDQMLLSIVEEEIAFLVIMRISRICQWRMIDPETGRELNP